MLAIMANGYVDWALDFGITPYVGAGIGWGKADFSARNRSGPNQTEIDDTDSVFVWNVMVGATVPIGQSLEFSLGYRYLASEDLRLAGRVGTAPRRFESHRPVEGLRRLFVRWDPKPQAILGELGSPPPHGPYESMTHSTTSMP